MNRNRLILVFFALLALLVPLGGPAYAGEGSPAGEAPQGPDLCDGLDCGQPPPPPPPPPPPGEPPPPPPEPSYLPMGWLDAISAEGVATGWTCDPNNFWAALAVHFYVDGPAGWGGTYIGQTSANGWREQGVADACGGNPYHGFSFKLPDSVRTGTARTLYVYAINIGPAASNPLLSGSPKWFTLQPPPNLNAELRIESFSSSSSEQSYYGGVRCKKYAFTEYYTQAGLWRVLRYDGGFGVCYRYKGGIVSIQYRNGDAYWVCCGWEWKGNETGYPYHIKESKKVTFFWRGKTAICIFSFGCGPERHPWITITFYDDNTMRRSEGIA